MNEENLSSTLLSREYHAQDFISDLKTLPEDSLWLYTAESNQLKKKIKSKHKKIKEGSRIQQSWNSITQKHSTYFELCCDSFKPFHVFIKNKNEVRGQTCFRESPCLSWMYFRNAVVHCKVVALSVSTVQNGTRRFSSSQQTRILRLQANTKG